MTIAAHITSTDPLGLASAGVINLVDITPSTPRSFLEVLLPTGKYKSAAVKTLKPLDQFDVTYELLDTASLVIPLGVAVNTNYLVSALSCTCGPDKYPEVKVSVIKPSVANKIKAYGGTATSITIAGGLGIVNKWGATSTAAFISSQMSISMQTLEAMEETGGDFLEGGIYKFGFKQETSFEAYAAITFAAAHAAPNHPATSRETREGWQIFSASFWKYLDPA